MQARDLIELAKDPRFIKGIARYCDNWCERCAFTSRCLVYAQRQADFDEDDSAADDLNDPKFLEKIGESFEAARELIKGAAAECGVDIDSLEPDDGWEERAERRETEAREHPLMQLAERYAVNVKEWFECEADALGGAYGQSFGTGNDILPEELEDAIDVIQWYQMLPAIRLFGGVVGGKDDIEPAIIDDRNGSVKVALIAMDRSILAWRRMAELFPIKAASIASIIAHLEELRSGTQREFPKARSFIRPGHDDASTHVM